MDIQNDLQKASFYKSFDGKWIAITNSSVFFSYKGYTFNELRVFERETNGCFEKIKFCNIELDEYGDIHLDLNQKLLRVKITNSEDNPIFRPNYPTQKITAIPLPTIREPHQLFLLKDQYVLLSREKYRDHRYKIFLGPMEELSEVNIIKTENGNFETSNGLLETNRAGTQPFWEGLALKRLSLHGYEIVEDGSIARITKKAK